MERIRQGSLYDEAAQRIRAMITDGRLEAGDRVPEKALCAQFGISRTPLREALKVLAAEGFVELLPNRGARVVELTREMLRSTIEVMGSLEGLSGELACERIDEAGIAEIRELHEQMLVHYREGDLAAYFEMNRRIHEALVAASNNQLLIDTYANLSERVRRFRFSTQMDADRWARVVAEHEKIVAALVARNGSELGAILRAHIRHKPELFL